MLHSMPPALRASCSIAFEGPKPRSTVDALWTAGPFEALPEEPGSARRFRCGAANVGTGRRTSQKQQVDGDGSNSYKR